MEMIFINTASAAMTVQACADTTCTGNNLKNSFILQANEIVIGYCYSGGSNRIMIPNAAGYATCLINYCTNAPSAAVAANAADRILAAAPTNAFSADNYNRMATLTAQAITVTIPASAIDRILANVPTAAVTTNNWDRMAALTANAVSQDVPANAVNRVLKNAPGSEITTAIWNNMINIATNTVSG